jgi:hypothetical protein
LDSQEEFLIKENKKHVKVKNAYAQEVEKNENLTKELSICHDSIANLRNENACLMAKVDKLNESISSLKTKNASLISKAKDLNVCNDSIFCLRGENVILHAKIEELNACKPSTSTVEHVSICTRCRDINVDAINDHLALIKQQNDHIAQLTAKLMSMKLKMKNLNLLEACSIMGHALALRMASVSNRKAMSSLLPLRNCPTLLRAKLPRFRIMRAIFYILLIILSIILGEFMLRNLILFLTMLLCIRMRHLALGILHMLKCLKRKLLLHQMCLLFHLRLLMHLMF